MKDTTEQIKRKLIHALTQYDCKQSLNVHYNPYALGIYFQRVDEVCNDIENGKSPREALLAGFSDRVLSVCLKSIGEKPFTKEEKEKGSLLYTPTKKK